MTPRLLAAVCVLGAAAAVAGCQEQLPLEGRPCPCLDELAGDDLICCATTNTCTSRRACPVGDDVEEGPVKVETRQGRGYSRDGMPFFGDEVVALAADRDGSLWIGTRCQGLFHAVNRPTGWSFSVIDAYTGLVPDSGIFSVQIGADGTRWAVSRRGYLYAIRGDGDNRRVTVYGEGPLVRAQDDARQPLALDDSGGIWFAPHSGSVALLRGVLVQQLFVSALGTTGVTALAFDARGRLWATRATGDVSTFDGHRWAPPSQPAAGEARAVLPAGDEGDVLLATTSGVALRKGKGNGISDEMLQIANQPEGKAGDVAFIRRGPDGLIAVAFSEQDGLAVGTTDHLVRVEFGPLRPYDFAFAGNDLFIAGGKQGVARLANVKALDLATSPRGPVIQATRSDERLQWRQLTLAQQVAQRAVSADVKDVLARPSDYFSKRVHLRTAVVSKGTRLSDASGRDVAIFPRVSTDWLNFLNSASLKSIPNFGSGTLQDYYGYVEYGGCYNNGDLVNVQFLITEHYPVSMPESERDRIRALIGR